MHAAVGHGGFEAAKALMRRDARRTLPVAAALGDIEDTVRLLPRADAENRHLTLAWAAQFGHAEIVRLLLDAGEDPNRHNPVGSHSHSTPLHQAALAGHDDVVRLLVERGARGDIRDVMWKGTAADWAAHAGRKELEFFLRSLEAPASPILP
jgi:ankyrin repeat protein